jgi:thioredoxin
MMKKAIVVLLVLCSVAVAGTRQEDLKYIVEKSYLDTQCEPFLNMMALEAIAGSEKKIEPEELVALFRKEFEKESTLAKFFEPYDALFSDEEVGELRKIYENPVWQKFSKQGVPLAQSHIMSIKDTFGSLVTQITAKRKAPAEIMQVTKANFSQLAELDKPVLLDISASWCSACKALEPVFEDLSKQYKGQIQFAKLDFDSEKELAHEFHVQSLPTLLFFEAGKSTPAMKSVGFMDKKELEGKINQFLKTQK